MSSAVGFFGGSEMTLVYATSTGANAGIQAKSGLFLAIFKFSRAVPASGSVDRHQLVALQGD